MGAEGRRQKKKWDRAKADENPGLTGGAADVDPQSQAAVAVVVGGRGCTKRANT